MAGTRYQVTFLGKSDFKAVLDDINKLTGKTYEIKFTANGKGLDNLNKKVQQVSKGLDTGSNKAKSFDSSMSNVGSGGGKQLTSLSAKIKNVGNDFLTTTKKVAKFGMSTAAIGLVTKGIHSAGQAVLELDSAMTEMRKVTSLNESELTAYSKRLGEMGQDVARTRTEMVEASTEFVKSGFSEDDAATLAKTASMFQNIADTQLSASEASGYIISQMKAFNIEASDSVQIIDKINEVANKTAVGTNDLQLALKTSGASLATFGNSYDESVSLVTSATEIMTGQAARVGRGFRSIAVNLGNLAQGSDVYRDATGKVNIALKDQEGNIRSTYDIMNDLYSGIKGQSVAWDELTSKQQAQIATQIAGKTQIDVFSSSLRNFSAAQDALGYSLNSAGSAAKENERAMDSLKNKINGLKAAFQELVFNIISSDLAGGFIDLATAALKFANTPFGKATIGVLATVTAVNKLSKAVAGVNILELIDKFSKLSKTGSVIDGITVAIKNMSRASAASAAGDSLSALSILQLGDATAEAKNFASKGIGAIKSATSGLAKSPLGKVLGIGSAIALLVTAIKYASEYKDKVVGAYTDAKDALSENAKEIKQLESQGRNLSNEDKIRLQYLRLQTAELEKQAKEARDKVLSGYNLGDVDPNQMSNRIDPATSQKKEVESIKQSTKAIQDKIAENKKLREEMEKHPELYGENIKKIKENNEAIKEEQAEYAEVKQVLDEAKDAGDEFNQYQEEAYNSLTKATNAVRDYNEQFADLGETQHATYINQLSEAFNDLDGHIQSASEGAKALKEAIAQTYNEGDALTEYGEIIDGVMEDAKDTLKGTNQFWVAANELLGQDFTATHNFDEVYARMQELQQMATLTTEGAQKFGEELYNAFNQSKAVKEELQDAGVSVEKLADGSVVFSGINSDNIEQVADAMGVSVEFLSAMLDGYQRLADIDLTNFEKVDATLKQMAKNTEEAGVAWDDTNDKALVFDSTIQEIASTSDKTVEEIKQAIEESGNAIIDLNNKDLSQLLHQFQTVDSSIVKFNGDLATVDVSALITNLAAAGYEAEEIKRLIGDLGQEEGVTLTIDGKAEITTEEAESKVDALTEATKKQQEEGKKVTDIKVTNKEALQKIQQVKTELDGIKSKTVTITVNKSGGGLLGLFGLGGKAEGGEAEDGYTMVNEEGAELIKRDDKVFMASNGMPTITKLQKGDYVYNAKQTKRILEGKATPDDYIKARAKGTLPGTTSGSSSGGGSKSSGKGGKKKGISTKSDKDNTERYMKELEKYFDRQLELFQRNKKSAAKFYSDIQRMGKKYAQQGKIDWDDYRKFNSDAVKEIFDEIEWEYDNGKIDAQKYHDRIIAQAKKFYKIGKIKYAEYRDYIAKANKELTESIKEQAKEAADAQVKYWEEAKNKIQGKLDAFEYYASKKQEELDKEIEIYQQQIDALQEKQEAIDKANEEIEEQIELEKLQQAVEDARKQKIRVLKLCPFIW